MVSKGLLDFWASAVAWIGGLIHLPAVPSFFSDVPGYIATASTYVASTDVWIPWTLLSTVIGAWAVCMGVALTIKLVRIVASFLSAGGGSAA